MTRKRFVWCRRVRTGPNGDGSLLTRWLGIRVWLFIGCRPLTSRGLGRGKSRKRNCEILVETRLLNILTEAQFMHMKLIYKILVPMNKNRSFHHKHNRHKHPLFTPQTPTTNRRSTIFRRFFLRPAQRNSNPNQKICLQRYASR